MAVMIEMVPLKVLGSFFFSSSLVWKNPLENIPLVLGHERALELTPWNRIQCLGKS